MGDGPAPESDLAPPGQGSPDGEQQDAHRSGLESAGGGAAGAADEHQDAGHGQGAVPEPPLSDAVKAGRAEGHRLEEAVENLLPEGHLPQGGGIVPLHRQEEEGAPHDQGSGEQEHHLGVEGQGPGLPPVAEDVLPDEEAQAADDDQAHDGQQDHRVPIVGEQAGKGAVIAQQVKARVAKGGDGVEDAPPDTAQGPILGDEAKGQKDGSHPFKEEGPHQSMPDHPDHPVHVVEVQGGDHDEPLREADPPPEGEGGQGDDGHKAQAAQLDHKDNDDLAEEGPVDPGVHHDQARYTSGRGCGEEAGEEWGHLPVPAGDGKHEEQGSGKDHDGEGSHYDPGWIQILHTPKSVIQPLTELERHTDASLNVNIPLCVLPDAHNSIPGRVPSRRGMLLLFYLSRGFIVRKRLVAPSSGFVMVRCAEEVPFLQGSSNFWGSIECPPAPSGSGQKSQNSYIGANSAQ